MIIALALMMASDPARDAAMERCAEVVVAKLHPQRGMADVTGTRFEWLQASTAGRDWVIIGSIIEPEGSGRIAHRFTCRTRRDKPPRVTIGKVIRL